MRQRCQGVPNDEEIEKMHYDPTGGSEVTKDFDTGRVWHVAGGSS
jgi:hypothetical protein